MKRFENTLVEMREHQKHDRFVQNTYLDELGSPVGTKIFHGCMFGCTMQTDSKPITKFCERYGMPLWMGFLCEGIFEGMDFDEAIYFPVQVMEKLVELPEDFDLEKVKHEVIIKRLENLPHDCLNGYGGFIENIIDYHKKSLVGTVENDEWINVDMESKLKESIDIISGKFPLEVMGPVEMTTEELILAAAVETIPPMLSETKSIKRSAWLMIDAKMDLSVEKLVAESAAWSLERDWLLEALTQ